RDRRRHRAETAERRLSLSPASKPTPTLGLRVQVMLTTRVNPPTIELKAFRYLPIEPRTAATVQLPHGPATKPRVRWPTVRPPSPPRQVVHVEPRSPTPR